MRKPDAEIVVPKNSQIKVASDFDGKTMACSELGTLGQLACAEWIDKNGGNSRQVEFIEIPFPAMSQALAQGRVDSAFPAEPFLTESKEIARIIADPFALVASRFNLGVWITTRQWADNHRDVLAAFVAIMEKTALWANVHHNQTAAILAKYGKLNPVVTKDMLRVPYALRLLRSEIQPVLDLATKYGTLSREISADQLIYNI